MKWRTRNIFEVNGLILSSRLQHSRGGSGATSVLVLISQRSLRDFPDAEFHRFESYPNLRVVVHSPFQMEQKSLFERRSLMTSKQEAVTIKKFFIPTFLRKFLHNYQH